MQPNLSTANDMRLRYRRPAPVVRRPVQPVVDVHSRSHSRPVAATPLPPRTERPASKSEPVQEVVPARSEREIFQLNLSDVAAAPIKQRRYLVKPRRGLHYILVMLCLLLLGAGGYISWQGYQSNKAVDTTLSQIENTSHTTPSGASTPPATSKPETSSLAAYKVSPDMPRYIRIGSLGVESRVRSLGLKDGQIASPANVHDAGWYNKSAKPGQTGAALISGHVSSWTTDGVFYKLKKIKAGAVVEIERGDGTKLQYRVVKTQVYNADSVDMAAIQQPVTGGKQGLNLITCTGKVKPGTNEFDQRLVVFTERI